MAEAATKGQLDILINSTELCIAVLAGFGAAIVLCHMRRHVDCAKFCHVVGGIVGLVLTGRDAAAGSFALCFKHDLRGSALGGAIGMGDLAGHRQPILILHRGVAHIAKLRLLPGGLAIKSAVGVAGTGMGVVLALLTVEVRAVIIVTAAVPRAKALL